MSSSAGIGVSGFRRRRRAAAVRRPVTVLDDQLDRAQAEKAELLEVLGGTVRLGPGATATLPDDADLVITHRAGRPAAPLLRAAAARPLPIWSEVELAWRLSRPDKIIPWLGDHGHQRQDHDHADARRRSWRAAGLHDRGGRQHRPPDHGDRPATRKPTTCSPCELSSHPAALVQLAGPALRPQSSTSQPDHLRVARRRSRRTRDAKAQDLRAASQVSCVYNVADPVTERMVEEAEVVEGAGPSASRWASPRRRCSASSTTCWSTGRSSQQRRDSALELRQRSADVTSRRAAQRRPTRWRRRRWPALVRRCRATAVRGRAASVQRRTPTRSQLVARARRDRAASTTPRPPTRTRRDAVAARLRLGGLDRRRPRPRARRFDELVTAHREPAARRGAARRATAAIIAEALARHAPGCPDDQVIDASRH